MRRFLILISITAILIGLKLSQDLTILSEVYPDAQYVFFLGDKEVSVGIQEAAGVRGNFRSIKGEAVRISGGERDIKILIEYLNGKILREEKVGNIKIIYGYSQRLGNLVTLNNDRINFQIAFNDGTITIGSPLIAGSY